MPVITFNPAQIGVNLTSIASNQTVASDAEADAAVADSKAVDGLSDAAVADGKADDGISDAAVADGKAVGAQSDVDVIEADDKFAKSIYSDPSSESFALLTMQITSASEVDMSHSDTPV